MIFGKAGAIGADNIAARHDLSLEQDIRMANNGDIVVPKNTDRGPSSVIFANYYRFVNFTHQRINHRLDELGLGDLSDANTVSANPHLLQDCTRFERAKAESDQASPRPQRSVTGPNRRHDSAYRHQAPCRNGACSGSG
jgi:hypothetical protein